MAKFVWNVPGQAPMSFPLRGERVSIGRDAGNDLRLSEPAVSSRHAVAIIRPGSVMIHDLNSSNGTLVNGKRVETTTLKHGDVVTLGRIQLSFIDESDTPAQQEQAKAGNTVRLGGGGGGAPGNSSELGAGEPDLDELDRLMGSIREHRQEEQQQETQKQSVIRGEWLRTLKYGHALKDKLANEPRIRFFDVSERREEIVLRIVSAEGQPAKLIMCTWGHPDLKDRADEGIWLRQTGFSDRRFEKSAEVVREIVAGIALFLT